MTHTPGPWAVKHERWIVATRGVHDGEIIVAPTYWMESPEAKAEAAANAVLIAAAPEMLAALQAITQRANETGIGPLAYQETVFAMHEIAREAIAKVEGRSEARD